MTSFDHSLAALDDAIRDVETASTEHDRGLAFARCALNFNYPNIDPFSDRYRSWVLDQYASVAGKPYSTSSERCDFDIASAVTRPWPYSTGSAQTVGNHIIAMGAALKALALPPGSRVADMGPGWGNTTEALARMKYDVTAIEIDPNFAELIRRRLEPYNVRIINGDFHSIASVTQPFDGVVFCECFHHCLDHVSLMRELYSATTLQGRVVFAAESIDPRYSFSWGVRPDGVAIWSVRKFGWLELGFSEDYFLNAMARTGWVCSKTAIPGIQEATVYLATKMEAGFNPGQILLARACDKAWAEREADPRFTHRFTGAVSRLPLPEWSGHIEIRIRNYHRKSRAVTMMAGSDRIDLDIRGHDVVTARVPYIGGADLMIETTPWKPNKIFRNGDSRVIGVAVEHIKIERHSH